MKIEFADSFYESLEKIWPSTFLGKVRRKLHDAWYYLKCALWHRYNRIHVKTLPPTWSDRCTVLPHAMFQILVDFIEREKPFDHFDTSYHQEDWDKIDNLYHWWKEVYLPFDAYEGYDYSKGTENPFVHHDDGLYRFELNDYDEKFYAEVHKKEEAMRLTLIAKMKELCELKDMLWT
jgi:hypothetical protein